MRLVYSTGTGSFELDISQEELLSTLTTLLPLLRLSQGNNSETIAKLAAILAQGRIERVD